MSAANNQIDLRILSILKKDYGNRVFARKTVLLIQHLLPDTEPLIEAFLHSCEPEHLFIVGIPYSSKRAVVERLERRVGEEHISSPAVYPLYQGQQYETSVKLVFDAALETCCGEQKLVIVEDGAYALPYLLVNRPEIVSQCVGVVQQTTRGLNIYTQLIRSHRGKITFPIVPIVGCEIKSEHEPGWITPAIVSNIRALLAKVTAQRSPFAGRTITVVGFGPVGMGLSIALRQEGATVLVAENNELRAMEARNPKYGFECGQLERLAPQSDLIIGATGAVKGPSIDNYIIGRLRDGTVLASVSSGNEEIDLPALREESNQAPQDQWPVEQHGVMRIPDFQEYLLRDGRRIVVLYGGFPVNFWSSQSMNPNDGDCVLSLLFSAAKKVALGEVPGRGIKDGHKTLYAEQERIAKHYLPK